MSGAGLVLSGTAGASPIDDLQTSEDFRVRMSAALLIGRSKLAGGERVLKEALADSHPAVRAAAASGLVELGDPSAIAALSARLNVEPNEDLKKTLSASIDKLKARSKDAKKPARAKFVVQVGAMRNMTQIKSKDLPGLLRGATKQAVESRVQSAAVIDESDKRALASLKKLPLLRLDGQLRNLHQAQQGNMVTLKAQVEFAVLRNHSLKATFSGSATAGGAASQSQGDGLRELQRKALESAVASAMGSAEDGFRAAL